MIIRLKYVAMTLNLKDASPYKTVTVATYNESEDPEGKKYRLEKLTRANLYNLAHDIYVYRFTSKLVPLATHPLKDGRTVDPGPSD